MLDAHDREPPPPNNPNTLFSVRQHVHILCLCKRIQAAAGAGCALNVSWASRVSGWGATAARCPRPWRMMSAAFSAIMIVGAAVCPPGILVRVRLGLGSGLGSGFGFGFGFGSGFGSGQP